MSRSNRFVIHLTRAERDAIERLAHIEKLAPSTFARRRLLFEAERRGVFPSPETRNRDATDSEAQHVAIAT